MKLIGISTLLILWMSFAEAHPLHLSITNITYENGKLKISMKTFRDDWEIAYFHFHGAEIDLLNEESLQDPWLSTYLEDRFSLAPAKGDIPTVISIDTILISDDTMVIEMQAELEGNPKSFYLYNALLTDIFPDQTNLVIFEYEEKEIGIKFDVRKHEEEVELK